MRVGSVQVTYVVAPGGFHLERGWTGDRIRHPPKKAVLGGTAQPRPACPSERKKQADFLNSEPHRPQSGLGFHS